MTPDVNVLVAAFRSDHVHHRIAAQWLLQARRRCLAGEALRLLPMVVTGFLRLVTNARVFSEPDPIEDAVAFIDALLGSPGVELAGTRVEWPLLRGLLLDRSLSGNDVPDAWIAAATQALGERLVTFDAGFRRLLPARDLILLR